MSNRQDKTLAFEKWVSQRDRGAISTWGLLKTCHNDGFDAGRDAERERVLGIVTDCCPAVAQEPFDDYVNSIGRGICDEITRRIKEQEK